MGELVSCREGRPKVRLIAHDDFGETSWGHSHHREVCTVQRECLSQYRRVRTQVLLPEGAAEYDHQVWRGNPAFPSQESGSHGNGHSPGREENAGGQEALAPPPASFA